MWDWLSEPVTWGDFIAYALIVSFIYGFIRGVTKSGK